MPANSLPKADNQFTSLYEGRDFVSVEFSIKNIRSLSNLRYVIQGLGDKPREHNAIDWALTGGVEGAFEYSLFGIVTSPAQWKSCTAELHVEPYPEWRNESEKAGFLGDGWFKDNKALFRLYLRPPLIRDILDKLYIFDAENKEEEHCLRCDVINLKKGSNNLEGAIVYRIVSLYC